MGIRIASLPPHCSPPASARRRFAPDFGYGMPGGPPLGPPLGPPFGAPPPPADFSFSTPTHLNARMQVRESARACSYYSVSRYKHSSFNMLAGQIWLPKSLIVYHCIYCVFCIFRYFRSSLVRNLLSVLCQASHKGKDGKGKW